MPSSARQPFPGPGPTAAETAAQRRRYGSGLEALYGEAMGKFTTYPRDLNIALRLVMAAKQGDNQAAREEERRWYENADQ